MISRGNEAGKNRIENLGKITAEDRVGRKDVERQRSLPTPILESLIEPLNSTGTVARTVNGRGVGVHLDEELVSPRIGNVDLPLPLGEKSRFLRSNKYTRQEIMLIRKHY